jgi:transcriptional regulator with XRE-family HTH domain
MRFGQNLQNLRNRAGLSQAQLAAKAGIPVKTIQAWEISRRTPRWIGTLLRLARGLGVPMEELAAGVAEEEGFDPQAGKGKRQTRAALPGATKETKKPRPRKRKGPSARADRRPTSAAGPTGPAAGGTFGPAAGRALL